MMWRILILLAISVTALCVPFGDVLAQGAGSTDCTSATKHQMMNAHTQGLLTAIMSAIIGVLRNISSTFYNQIISSNTYITSLWGLVLLVIITYGMMVVMGTVKFAPAEIFMRALKIGIIVWLVSPTGGWANFEKYVAPLFWNTTLDLVRLFTTLSMTASMNITTTSFGSSGGAGTFEAMAVPIGLLDTPLARLFSTTFFITVVGSLTTGPYGWFMAVLLVWGAVCLLGAVFSAMYSYIKSIVAIWFLFSIAPVFFVMLFFKRMSHVFSGWMNLIIGYSFQIIMLFAFLSFFIVIIVNSLQGFMQIEWCYTKVDNLVGGLPIQTSMWRPHAINRADGSVTVLGEGAWSFYGFKNNKDLMNPLDLYDVLFFVLASYVAWNYTKFVPLMAMELAGSGLRISGIAADASEYFREKGYAPETLAAQGAGWAFKKLR